MKPPFPPQDIDKLFIRQKCTAMFAVLALGGDIDCSGGPTLAGTVAGAFREPPTRFSEFCRFTTVSCVFCQKTTCHVWTLPDTTAIIIS